jgi:hypothetical protein
MLILTPSGTVCCDTSWPVAGILIIWSFVIVTLEAGTTKEKPSRGVEPPFSISVCITSSTDPASFKVTFSTHLLSVTPPANTGEAVSISIREKTRIFFVVIFLRSY